MRDGINDMLSSVQVRFGSKLKSLRKKANFTQTELAEKLGVKRGAIANYEIGLGNPSLSQLYALSEVLDCEMDDLLPKTSEIYRDPSNIQRKIKSQLGQSDSTQCLMSIINSL